MSNLDIYNIINSVEVKPEYTVVFDIDDTLIDLEGNPIKEVVDFYNYVKSRGFKTDIITARANMESVFDFTFRQLNKVGVTHYDSIHLRPVNENNVAKYKNDARQNLVDSGKIVIMSLGDNVFDYRGFNTGLGVRVEPKTDKKMFIDLYRFKINT